VLLVLVVAVLVVAGQLQRVTEPRIQAVAVVVVMLGGNLTLVAAQAVQA
jgi:hypothetical protein